MKRSMNYRPETASNSSTLAKVTGRPLTDPTQEEDVTNTTNKPQNSNRTKPTHTLSSANPL
jgi:hypothetical protein